MHYTIEKLMNSNEPVQNYFVTARDKWKKPMGSDSIEKSPGNHKWGQTPIFSDGNIIARDGTFKETDNWGQTPIFSVIVPD